MVGEQLQELGLKHRTIILEPFTRDTAPAIALAALYLADNNPNALMLVMPADQVIGSRNAFHKAVQQASTAAQKGAIVTFGIVPTQVNTNFGYIKTDVASTSSLKTVVAFKEKPDDETARGFLKEGGYFWNGGIFLMTASTYLAELEKYTPEIVAASRKAMNGIRSDEKLDFLRIDKEEFALSPSISIDYAVMESTDKALLIPLDADWNDLGSWSALWEVADKDGCGNASLCHYECDLRIDQTAPRPLREGAAVTSRQALTAPHPTDVHARPLPAGNSPSPADHAPE